MNAGRSAPEAPPAHVPVRPAVARFGCQFHKGRSAAGAGERGSARTSDRLLELPVVTAATASSSSRSRRRGPRLACSGADVWCTAPSCARAAQPELARGAIAHRSRGPRFGNTGTVRGGGSASPAIAPRFARVGEGSATGGKLASTIIADSRRTVSFSRSRRDGALPTLPLLASHASSAVSRNKRRIRSSGRGVRRHYFGARILLASTRTTR